MTPERRDEAFLCLLAIAAGRLVPADGGGLTAVFPDMPPLPVARWAFDWLESAGLMVVVADDRGAVTPRGRWQLRAWAGSRGTAFLRRLRDQLEAA